jgi:predicted PurR-regulated permease PerM
MAPPLRSLAIGLVAAVAALYVLRFAEAFLIPIVLAILVSYALSPLVNTLVRVGLPRLLATSLILLALLAGLGAGLLGLWTQAVAVAERLPDAARELRLRLEEQRGGPLEKVQEAAEELEQTGEGASASPRKTRDADAPAFDVRAYLWSASAAALAFGAQAAMVIFLVFFVLLSGDLYKRKLVRIVGPTLARKRVTVEILDEIAAHVGRFLLVRGATSAVVGLVTGLALWGIGLQQAAVWGVMAAVFNSIPYFGPFLVTAGLAMVGFLQFGTISMALAVAGIALVVTSIEGWLVTPPLLGRAARMNAVAVFVSLIFWSWLWGVAGLILAVPIMMAVKTVCDHVEDLRPVGELLGP